MGQPAPDTSTCSHDARVVESGVVNDDSDSGAEICGPGKCAAEPSSA